MNNDAQDSDGIDIGNCVTLTAEKRDGQTVFFL